MLNSPSIFTTIFAFALVLGPLVLIHELGHYLVGRLFKVKADVFSIGFGKEIVGWTDKRGTRWKLAVWPLGGYVQFAGDSNAVSMPDADIDMMSEAERAVTFQVKPLWQRFLIVLAGPMTNLVFALAIFAAFNFAYGRVDASPVIGGFSEKAAAQSAGLRAGDRIITIDGEAIEDFDAIRQRVMPFPGQTISVLAERDGQRLTLPVRIALHVEKDRFGNEARIGLIGIHPPEPKIVPVGAVESVTLAGKQCVGIVRMMITGIRQIVVGDRSVSELGGPIKIAKFSGEQFTLGWPQFVSFVALISINLAFINFLPIPALDGGHLAFYVAEAVRRKPISLRSQEWAYRTGLAFVLALMLFVTVNDIIALPIFGG